MDYLIFGVGFGSTLVLIGWLLRQFGPAFRYRNEPDDVLSAEQILERNDWQRFCIAMGALLSVCGAVILLVTLITLLVRPSDRVGTIIVGALFVLSLLAVAAWVVMYVNQHRALAGDRRAEVLATKTTRKPAKSRPDATTTTTAAPAEGSSVKAASGASNASAESLEDLNRRRRAAQQLQRRPAGTPTASPAAQESASRPTSRPAQQAARSEEIADDIRGEIVSTVTPVADPAQALRNVHFKRAGSSRTRDESSTTTTTTTAAPARSVEVRDTDPIEDDGDPFDDGRPDTSRSDA